MFLIAHHGERLQELYDLVAAGHDDIVSISSHAKWRYENWNEWPLDQKFFSMGETMAHLVHLCAKARSSKPSAATSTVSSCRSAAAALEGSITCASI